MGRNDKLSHPQSAKQVIKASSFSFSLPALPLCFQSQTCANGLFFVFTCRVQAQPGERVWYLGTKSLFASSLWKVIDWSDQMSCYKYIAIQDSFCRLKLWRYLTEATELQLVWNKSIHTHTCTPTYICLEPIQLTAPAIAICFRSI